MNVLQVLPSVASESGGPVRSTLANCRAVSSVDSEARFTLATTDQGLGSRWRAALEQRMPPSMELVPFPAYGRHAYSFSPRLARWLWRHVGEFDLMVVRALLHPVSSTAAWIARRQCVPYVVVPHGTLSGYTFRYRRTLLKRTYFRLVERHTLAGAAAVRFTSEAERRGAPPFEEKTRTFIIPHPFEPEFKPPDSAQRRPDQIPFLSRLHPVKGIDVLLEGFRRVRAEVPAARLVLAGSGTPGHEQSVRSRVEHLGLSDSVELPGFVEGAVKADLLEQSAVFALPSHQENFGVAVVEAMDAGLPVIISRGVDIWPEVEEAGAGIVLDERTPDAVATALFRLLADADLRDEMGRHGRKLVRTAFSLENVGRRLCDLYGMAVGMGTTSAGALA